MTITAGTRFGSYEVLGTLGAGAMGEVYRARDLKLQRDVAIKMVPGTFTADRDRLARLEREARVLASLNHPNIAAIYGLEDASGVPALILELVEGPTLAERLVKGPLPPVEALRIARQIATGLEAAHEKGVVHRDLKPANVKVESDGSVKILDFGVAKTIVSDASATHTANRTEEGTTVGTPAYMSPEQLRGAFIDKRADIWAFGCVVFETLAGRHPFGGGTVPEVVARILEWQPDWDALPADLPGWIRTLLRRCLQKDPADRLHDIADARIELAEALSAPGQAVAMTISGSRQARAGWIATVVLGSIAAVVLGFVTIWFGSRESGTSTTAAVPIEFGLRFPPEHRPASGLAVSPDGRYIATALYADVPQIWLTSLDSAESRPLAGTEGGTGPFWSSDGSQIAFFRRGKLSRIARSGGPVTDICDAPFISYATWSDDGVILFSSGRKLMQVPASGGTPKDVRIALEPEVTSMVGPGFLPDNRHFLFCARYTTSKGIWRIGSLDSDKTTGLFESPWSVRFARPNHVLFVRGASLVAQSLDLRTFRLAGPEKTLVPNVLSGALVLGPTFSASQTVLAFVRPFAGEPGQLMWFDDTGARQGSIPPPPEGEYLNPSISPDGDSVAFNAMDPQTGTWDIWIWNRSRGFASRLTTDPANDSDALWSPDGKQVVFTSNRTGRLGFYRRSVDASGADEPLVTIDGDVVIGDWSRDGRYIVYSHRNGLSPYSIWAVPLFGERTPVQLIDERFSPYSPRLSPDGRWLAYIDLSTGSLEVHVRRFMAEGERAQISHGGGLHPRWIADGRGMTYAKIGGGIAAVDLEFDTSGIRVGPERILMPLPVGTMNDTRSHYDVTRDGHRLLVRSWLGHHRPQSPSSSTGRSE
jgi:Tol biopolymer transport system component